MVGAALLGVLTACSPGHNATVAVGYDPSGRLIAAANVCHHSVAEAELVEAGRTVGTWERSSPLEHLETWSCSGAGAALGRRGGGTRRCRAQGPLRADALELRPRLGEPPGLLRAGPGASRARRGPGPAGAAERARRPGDEWLEIIPMGELAERAARNELVRDPSAATLRARVDGSVCRGSQFRRGGGSRLRVAIHRWMDRPTRPDRQDRPPAPTSFSSRPLHSLRGRHLENRRTKRICRAAPVGAARQIGVSTRRAPEGIRTPNLLIRSQMLYPLSYGCLCSVVVRGGSGI